MTTQPIPHKNKTLAALLAAIGGGLGLHRFYLNGRTDQWGWLHLISFPLSICIYFFYRNIPTFFTVIPFILSILIGFLASLLIGITPDEKWDARFNPGSSRQSDSGWPIALILVMTMAIGAFTLIAVIARTFDLLYTGGLYG